jgi:ketosteroid isomerase-like protein
MKMRPSFIVSGLILLCAVSAPAQNLQSTTELAVRQVLQRQQEAGNHHDLESFMSGYWNSPELTFFSGAKISSGWQATIERYRKTYQSEGREMGKLEFSDLNIEVLAADAALVRGAWHLSLSDGKTPHGLFTLIFRKFPDGWKIIHDHTSAAE